jgi:hypothetical protein
MAGDTATGDATGTAEQLTITAAYYGNAAWQHYGSSASCHGALRQRSRLLWLQPRHWHLRARRVNFNCLRTQK